MRPFPVARAGNGLGMDEERDRGDEQVWDCHCHGSRFTIDGQVVEGPAEEPLEPKSL